MQKRKILCTHIFYFYYSSYTYACLHLLLYALVSAVETARIFFQKRNEAAASMNLMLLLLLHKRSVGSKVKNCKEGVRERKKKS